MEDSVIQSCHLPRKHICKNVIKVSNLARNMITPLLIMSHQAVGLSPKVGFVYTVAAKQRALHVFRN